MEVKLLDTTATQAVATDTRNIEIYTLCLKGRQLLDQPTVVSLERAQRHFEETIALNPDYAPAYAGLALVLNELTWAAGTLPAATYPKAKAMAERALAPDSNLPDAWVALATRFPLVHITDSEWFTATQCGSTKQLGNFARRLPPGLATSSQTSDWLHLAWRLPHDRSSRRSNI